MASNAFFHEVMTASILAVLAGAITSGCGVDQMEPGEVSRPLPGEPIMAEAPQALTHNGHDYLFIRSAKTWWDASSICEGFGYGLVTINDAQEEAWLHGFEGNSAWWLGYNDIQTEGTWHWSHGSSSYINWNSSQPDNWSNEDCAQDNFNGTGRWNDLPCSYGLYFICESLD